MQAKGLGTIPRIIALNWTGYLTALVKVRGRRRRKEPCIRVGEEAKPTRAWAQDRQEGLHDQNKGQPATKTGVTHGSRYQKRASVNE